MEAKHLDANVQSPDGIAFAPDDTLYVADTGNHVIRAVDLAAGRTRRVAGDGREGKTQSLAKPESLLRTPDGALWFIAGLHRSSKVYRLEPGTGQLDVAYDPRRQALNGVAMKGAATWQTWPQMNKGVSTLLTTRICACFVWMRGMARLPIHARLRQLCWPAMAHWAFCKLTAHPQTARSDISPAWRWARKAKSMCTRPLLRGTWPGLTPVRAAL
ncbi:hypothetical protein IYN88_23605 [Comamonas testosteroni]|nr:hypothetical protein IYN88_23605 [Comamonas testosteroni]